MAFHKPRANHRRNLNKILGISQRIRKFAQKRYTLAKYINEEDEREILNAAKEQRHARLARISSNHRYVIEIVADFFGLDPEEVVAGITDSESYVTQLDSIFNKNESLAALFFNETTLGYPINSGRYTQRTKNQPIKRIICINAQNAKLADTWVVAYRNTNRKNIENKILPEEVGIFNIQSQVDQDSVIKIFEEFSTKILTPAIKSTTEWGLSTGADKSTFIHRLVKYNKCLKTTEKVVRNRVVFEVSHKLYKGFLLVKYQVEETALDRVKVGEVERYFSMWMRQIKSILVEGKQLQADPSDAGPLQILEYWRRMLTRYTSIFEFISSRAFVNHHSCLVLSRSTKLLKKWKELDEQITSALIEANDNVRYISTLETFWDPIYRTNLPDIVASLPGLMLAIQNLCKTAHFFNKSENITSLLVKITNQLTVTCREFLTEGGEIEIWVIPSVDLIQKIEQCKEVMQIYKTQFFQTIEQMNEHLESSSEISSVYIFCYMDKFMSRLDKIKDVANIENTYSILNRIQISGMEIFANQIKSAKKKISFKPYDPLDFRLDTFKEDYNIFVHEVEEIEGSMQQFVKKQIHGIPTVESVILVLKRFDRLNLDCLSLDRRYLDVAEMLINEIIALKDA